MLKIQRRWQKPVYFLIKLQTFKIKRKIYLAIQYAKFVDTNSQIFPLEEKRELLQHFLQHSAAIK